MDEIFPDEIFLKIFRYIPRLDLFRGFYNLNARLNRIISEARVYFGYFSLSKEEQQYILPYVQPKQLRSFTVNEEQYQYSKLNQCINMRELIFQSGSKYDVYTYQHPDLIHVKPSIFPHLKSLTIIVQSNSNVYINLCIMIFSNEFPTLESVSLPYGNGSHWASKIKTWSTNLKDVTIKCCNKSMFYPLLNNLPNILRFECGFGATYKGSLTKECLSLTHLTLDTYDIWSTSSNYYPMFTLGEMMDLFKRSPNLERAILYICDFGELHHIIDQLNRILSNCPKLKQIYCHIQYFKENSVCVDEIKNRYPLFEKYGAFISKATKGYICQIK